MSDATAIAVLSAAISLLSLTVSATTMWFAWLRRGRLAMTTPTLVFFGYDEIPRNPAKIFLRTLLYSTSSRGKVIEGMYVAVRHETDEHIFSFWGYGETTAVTAGSGLYVGQTGVALNHHFNVPANHLGYEFVAGKYTIQVFARLAGRGEAIQLAEVKINLSEEHATALRRRNGVLFELASNGHDYIGRTRD